MVAALNQHQINPCSTAPNHALAIPSTRTTNYVAFALNVEHFMHQLISQSCLSISIGQSVRLQYIRPSVYSRSHFQISTSSVSLDRKYTTVCGMFSESYDQQLSDFDFQSVFFQSVFCEVFPLMHLLSLSVWLHNIIFSASKHVCFEAYTLCGCIVYIVCVSCAFAMNYMACNVYCLCVCVHIYL